jgi:5,10-methylenetetrahydrofolate reductase
LLERFDRAENPMAEGIAIARETVSWARDLCQGVHLMTLGHEDKIPAILA